MNADIRKFEELMKTDPETQAKLQEAAERYQGEISDEKALFENVLLPVANEAGLSATYEELQEYMGSVKGQSEGELSEEELSQVAGGKNSGIGICAGIGIGDLFGTEDSSYRMCEVIGGGICPGIG